MLCFGSPKGATTPSEPHFSQSEDRATSRVYRADSWGKTSRYFVCTGRAKGTRRRRYGMPRYERYQIDCKRHRGDTKRTYGRLSKLNSYRQETSDAQDQFVRHCRCFDPRRCRRMARLAPGASVAAPVGIRVDPLQMMMNAKDLPTERYHDFSLMFD